MCADRTPVCEDPLLARVSTEMRTIQARPRQGLMLSARAGTVPPEWPLSLRDDAPDGSRSTHPVFAVYHPLSVFFYGDSVPEGVGMGSLSPSEHFDYRTVGVADAEIDKEDRRGLNRLAWNGRTGPGFPGIYSLPGDGFLDAPADLVAFTDDWVAAWQLWHDTVRMRGPSFPMLFTCFTRCEGLGEEGVIKTVHFFLHCTELGRVLTEQDGISLTAVHVPDTHPSVALLVFAVSGARSRDDAVRMLDARHCEWSMKYRLAAADDDKIYDFALWVMNPLENLDALVERRPVSAKPEQQVYLTRLPASKCVRVRILMGATLRQRCSPAAPGRAGSMRRCTVCSYCSLTSSRRTLASTTCNGGHVGLGGSWCDEGRARPVWLTGRAL